VKELNYPANFNAFFVDTMIFYLGENGWTEVYTVVFGQVKDSNLVSIYPRRVRRGTQSADILTE
jgi:hypothetical protein